MNEVNEQTCMNISCTTRSSLGLNVCTGWLFGWLAGFLGRLTVSSIPKYYKNLSLIFLSPPPHIFIHVKVFVCVKQNRNLVAKTKMKKMRGKLTREQEPKRENIYICSCGCVVDSSSGVCFTSLIFPVFVSHNNNFSGGKITNHLMYN